MLTLYSMACWGLSILWELLRLLDRGGEYVIIGVEGGP